MKKHLLNIFLISFILLSILNISAVETLGTFKQNSCIELKQNCANCSYVNITSVSYPNSSKIITNVVMTKDRTNYNYTFCNTTVIGEYIVDGNGDLDGEITVWTYNFFVTHTGDELDNAESLLYIGGMLLLVFIFIMCLYGAIRLPYKNKRADDGRLVSVNDLKYLKVFLYTLSYILLMFIFGIGRSLSANFLYLNGLERIFNFLFWILFSFLWPLMVLSIILTIIIYLDDKRLKKAMMRGVPFR